MTLITVPVKRTFNIFVGEGANPSTPPAMAMAIEDIVNTITKEVEIAKLPAEQFEETFMVRMGPHGEFLAKEANKNIVSYVTHVALRSADADKKLIFFGIWKRLGASAVLK